MYSNYGYTVPAYGCGGYTNTNSGFGSGYALILVLFILLVIIGSAWATRSA